ncbi:MAG: preprotein translocase subunit SecY, partial [Candidatus Omnitrophica bacterium]|nr:preprotein translocase subunit SecY [Candidatus Omnitrophota bacterium]
MLSSFLNCFKIPELKKKILFTLAIVAAYRIGCFIPTPGVNGAMLQEFFDKMSAGGEGSIFGIMNLFSGGA